MDLLSLLLNNNHNDASLADVMASTGRVKSTNECLEPSKKYVPM